MITSFPELRADLLDAVVDLEGTPGCGDRPLAALVFVAEVNDEIMLGLLAELLRVAPHLYDPCLLLVLIQSSGKHDMLRSLATPAVDEEEEDEAVDPRRGVDLRQAVERSKRGWGGSRPTAGCHTSWGNTASGCPFWDILLRLWDGGLLPHAVVRLAVRGMEGGVLESTFVMKEMRIWV